MPGSEGGWSDERICLAGVLAVATSIVYGSLVPFDFKHPADLGPGGWLTQIEFASWSLVSATDVLVNIAAGAALGFVVMGLIRTHQRAGRLAVLTAVIIVGGMAAILGGSVELLQALSPTRRSSWNDVLAQAVGACTGAVVWLVAGRAAIQWVRDLRVERSSWSFAARLLQLYLPIYVVLQLTPFDSDRAAELATKYNAGQPALMPSVYSIHGRFPWWFDLIGAALLAIPIGCLSVVGWVRAGGWRAVTRAVPLGMSLIVAIAISQYVLCGDSRLTGLYAGVVGILIGVAVVIQQPLSRRWMVLAVPVWMLVLLVHSWYPLDFALSADIVTRRLTRISLMPFGFYYWYAAYIVSPLGAVHETLLDFVRTVPLGFFFRLAWPAASEPGVRRLQTVATMATVITVLLAIELGQAFLPMRFPDVTDALAGTIGAAVGIAIAVASMCRQPPVLRAGVARRRHLA
jgi:glycopeptide antibiotics resistance protein